MSKLFLWLGGADEEVLARCPSERRKYAALGGAVATTAVMAALAGTFAAHDWLHVGLGAALPVGLFWGAAIMNLDRWLLMTIRRQETPPRTLLLALPRLALAIVVGLVISEPLVLAVFRNEVTAQAVQDRQQQVAAGRRALDAQYAEIPRLEVQRDRLQAALASSGEGAALSDSPDYGALQRQIDAQQGRLAAAQHSALCELDGTCGTHHRGVGSSYLAKRKLADQLEQSLGRLRAQQDSLKSSLQADVRSGARRTHAFSSTQLTQVEADLARLRHQRNGDVQQLLHANAAPIGLLDRVEALSALSAAHPAVRERQILLTMFILLVDVVPVLFKVLSLVGRRSLYEQVQDDLEARELRRVAFEEDQRDSMRRIGASAILEEAQMHAAFVREAREIYQYDAHDDVIDRIVAIEREAADRFIAALRTALLDEVPERVRRHVSDLREGRARRGGPPRPGGETRARVSR
jgi:hypothetical protein